MSKPMKLFLWVN